MLRVLGGALILLCLGGCQLVEIGQKMFEVIKDPDIQVGDDGEQASTAGVTFFSQRNANVNAFGEAVPISVLVLQMRGDAALNQADILEFMDDPEAALGKEYIDSSEHSIPPGEFLALDPLELEEEATYIGFVALFAETDGAIWRTAEAVEPVGKVYNITVEVGSLNLRVALEEK